MVLCQCPYCGGFCKVHLKKHATPCVKCRATLQIDPERVVLSKFFLATVVIAVVVVYGVFTESSSPLDVFFALAFVIPLPVAAFFAVFVLSNAEILQEPVKPS